MFRNILVAVDGSEAADKGLRAAIEVAQGQRAPCRLTLLYVLQVMTAVADMQGTMESVFERHLEAMRRHGREVLDRAASLVAQAGIEARPVLREARVARAADAITQEAREGFDLLVIGSHGRRGFQRFLLGSDAELVLRGATIPVLLVRSDETAVHAAKGPEARASEPAHAVGA